MTIRSCQRWLAGIWFVACALLFVLLMLRTIKGASPTVTTELWKWILPNIVPFVSLITGAIFVIRPVDGSDAVDGFVFYIAVAGSVLYLVTLFLLLVFSPHYQPNVDEGAFLRTTNFWLAPLQAVDSAALGIFFMKQRPAKPPAVAGP
ncbi:hypothetical protein [Burkholderia ubonensis]|uniref:hypothetical protein n=1 Tax=Burkholderia ubonensis TaxID=101571 RepID=UPI002AB01D73|nr:hypothetical protein [Burkholderia ubonensis]